MKNPERARLPCSGQKQYLQGWGWEEAPVGAPKCCLLRAEQPFPHPLAQPCQSALLINGAEWSSARRKDRVGAPVRDGVEGENGKRKTARRVRRNRRKSKQEAHRDNEKK